jgi:hypothetical protein
MIAGIAFHLSGARVVGVVISQDAPLVAGLSPAFRADGRSGGINASDLRFYVRICAWIVLRFYSCDEPREGFGMADLPLSGAAVIVLFLSAPTALLGGLAREQ